MLGFNPSLNRVGQNSKNPVTVGKTGQNVIKFYASWKLKHMYSMKHNIA